MLIKPDDPLLPEVAANQPADHSLSALTAEILGEAGEESDTALLARSPSSNSWGQYAMRGGLQYSKGRLWSPPTSTALILKNLQQDHDNPLAGHYGVARIQALVAQYYTWPGLATAVSSYVRSCDTCAKNKVVRHPPYGLLSPLPIPSKPWSSVSLD